jgi:outer membrane protein assembly factor BamB
MIMALEDSSLMKKTLGLVALFVAAAVALGQEGTIRIHTKPVLPSLETLDRLNLKMAWKIKVPMDGLRDGFFTLQLFPGTSAPLLLAQTYQGAVVAINAETGEILWRTLIGRPYEIAQPAAVNDQTVFACRREFLYALDRDTGKQVLYTAQDTSPVPAYGFALEATPSAGLVADDEFLFIPMSDQLVRFDVPNFRVQLKLQAPTAGGAPQDSPQVIRQWAYNATGESILQTPILTRGRVVLTTTEGTIFVVDKFSGATSTRFQTEGKIKGSLAYDKSVVYIPCEDYFLYAFDTATGRLLWRFPGQAQIVRSVVATDNDVYVSPTKAGLYRLDRLSGLVRWNNKQAVRFLAGNKRFVYAMDGLGQVMVLDYERGKELARWDTRDWNVPLSNDFTDRIYLPANDGQIICLRHRENVKPLIVKTLESLKPPPPEKKDEKKDELKDGEKNGDKDKGTEGKVGLRPLPLGYWRPAADGQAWIERRRPAFEAVLARTTP